MRVEAASSGARSTQQGGGPRCRATASAAGPWRRRIMRWAIGACLAMSMGGFKRGAGGRCDEDLAAPCGQQACAAALGPSPANPPPCTFLNTAGRGVPGQAGPGGGAAAAGRARRQVRPQGPGAAHHAAAQVHGGGHGQGGERPAAPRRRKQRPRPHLPQLSSRALRSEQAVCTPRAPRDGCARKLLRRMGVGARVPRLAPQRSGPLHHEPASKRSSAPGSLMQPPASSNGALRSAALRCAPGAPPTALRVPHPSPAAASPDRGAGREQVLPQAAGAASRRLPPRRRRRRHRHQAAPAQEGQGHQAARVWQRRHAPAGQRPEQEMGKGKGAPSLVRGGSAGQDGSLVACSVWVGGGEQGAAPVHGEGAAAAAAATPHERSPAAA